MANYERLSPGVYRGPNGALVHKGGRPINPQEARQMQGGRQVQMKPQPMGLPPQQQFDGMQSATRQDFNAGQAPMDEMGMSGHQFGSMRNQMGPSGAPPGAGPSGEVQRFYAGGSPNFNEQTGQATGAAPGSFDMNSFGMNPQPLAQGNGAPPPTGGPATMPQGGQRPQKPRVTAGERLSPGVYRGSDGSLVGKNGRPLPNQGGGGRQQAQVPQEPNPWSGKMPTGPSSRQFDQNNVDSWYRGNPGEGQYQNGDMNSSTQEQFNQTGLQMPQANAVSRPIRTAGRSTQGGAFPGRKTAGVAGMPPKGRGRY